MTAPPATAPAVTAPCKQPDVLHMTDLNTIVAVTAELAVAAELAVTAVPELAVTADANAAEDIK